MNKKIKILHILWSGRSGGAERFVHDITIYSDKKIFEHEVCFLSQGGWLADEMVKNAVNVYYLGMKSGFSVLAALQLFFVISKIKADIINTHSKNYLANTIIMLFSKIKKVHFEHGGNLIGNNPKRDVMFYNYLGRFYDSIIANSNYVKNKLIKLTKVNPDKIKMFSISIDPEKYECKINNSNLKTQLGISLKNKVIGMVGRLVESKGIDDFIKVASEIQALYKSCSFVVVFEGNLEI